MNSLLIGSDIARGGKTEHANLIEHSIDKTGGIGVTEFFSQLDGFIDSRRCSDFVTEGYFIGTQTQDAAVNAAHAGKVPVCSGLREQLIDFAMVRTDSFNHADGGTPCLAMMLLGNPLVKLPKVFPEKGQFFRRATPGFLEIELVEELYGKGPCAGSPMAESVFGGFRYCRRFRINGERCLPFR